MSKDLFDVDLCEKISLFPYFLVLIFKNYLSDVSILPVLRLQIQQVMTSLIRSHIEYLIQTVLES